MIDTATVNTGIGEQKAMPLAADTTITFSVFDSIKATTPKPVVMTHSSFGAYMTKHAVLPNKKDGLLWSPATFLPGTSRKNVNVVSISALVMDCDDGTPPDDIRTTLQATGVRFIVHTSYGHAISHPKYRVIVPLDRPVPVAAWEAIWQRFNQLVGGSNDPATKDPVRMYFAPAKPRGADGHFAECHDGRLITLSDLPPAPEREAEDPSRIWRAPTRRSENPHALDEAAEYEGEAGGLTKMVYLCHFISAVADPVNQGSVPEPLWMAMLSNVCRFKGGRAFAHQASSQHEDYCEAQTDARLARYLESAGPVTCNRIRSLGFTGCPGGGCILPTGKVTRSPAGLGLWGTWK